jgi:hypothetical protein
MKTSRWPDFLFTISVRFICGSILGGLAFFLFGWRGILRVLTHNHIHGPLIWLGLCGLAGGIVAVFTVPRWQTPWYQRDSKVLDLIQEEMEPLSQEKPRPGSDVVKTSISIKAVGKDGVPHEYSSMEEAPPELRSEIEALQKEAAQEKGNEVSVTETSLTGNAITSKIIQSKKVSVYKIVDDSGVERIYHSLDEMPAEIRAAFAEAEKKLK